MHAGFARASLLSFSQRRAPCRPQTADKRPQRAVRADRPLSPPERAPAGAPRHPRLRPPLRPPASHQTKVDGVLFKFQRQWLGSFAETITLLLGTNVDI